MVVKHSWLCSFFALQHPRLLHHRLKWYRPHKGNLMRYVIQDDWQVSATQGELMPAILELSPPYNLP